MSPISDKMCRLPRFFLRQTEPLLAERDRLHQKTRVPCKHTHRLQALGIFLRFTNLSAMYAVPILAGSNWHSADREILVQFIECRGAASSSCNDYACTDLHCLIEVSAEKLAVKASDERCICRSVINRRRNYKTVGSLEFRCKLIDGIIEHAPAQLCALAAGNTAADIIIGRSFSYHAPLNGTASRRWRKTLDLRQTLPYFLYDIFVVLIHIMLIFLRAEFQRVPQILDIAHLL